MWIVSIIIKTPIHRGESRNFEQWRQPLMPLSYSTSNKSLCKDAASNAALDSASHRLQKSGSSCTEWGLHRPSKGSEPSVPLKLLTSSDEDQKLQICYSPKLVIPSYSTIGQKDSLQNRSCDGLMALLFAVVHDREASSRDTRTHEANRNPESVCLQAR